MSDDPHAREQALYDLLACDHYNLHDMGEKPDLYPALKRLAVVLGGQQPEYMWATVTSNDGPPRQEYCMSLLAMPCSAPATGEADRTKFMSASQPRRFRP